MSHILNMYQISIKIIGRVQGVNLRRSLKSYAVSKGIFGFVKNEDDGSVSCVAQGKREQLEELLGKCQQGFGLAHVQAMSFEWEESPIKKYKNFKIVKDHQNFFLDQASSFVNLGKHLFSRKPQVSYPKHIVVIPDGNRRWARAHGWKPWVGHKKAMRFEKLRPLLDMAKKYEISYLSFWAFSTENWNRDQEELNVLFDIYRENVEKYAEEFNKEGVKFTHFGRKDRLPSDIVKSMHSLEEKTRNNKKLFFQFCLDYNGRDDLVRAINSLIKKGITHVDEQIVAEHLDTGMNSIPDPDLIIRTSGEQRTSGMMAYQAAYAELYFTQVHFPDFDETELERAILDYAGRTRRFGGTNSKDLVNINPNKLVEPTTN